MDSKEQIRTERRGGLLSRLRPGEPSAPPTEGIEGLLHAIKVKNPEADTKDVERAYAFAEEHHRGQLRKSGEAFINHPLAVAPIVGDLGLDPTTLQAARRHDTVGGTDC